ncbi:MAG TPA: hypothetical protein DHV62_05460 [Elusimicrobia bacterium]|jgi:SAM-dependent methyltransferase|nr:hypothetical protein [Elusimicrobiota bacterium]
MQCLLCGSEKILPEKGRWEKERTFFLCHDCDTLIFPSYFYRSKETPYSLDRLWSRESKTGLKKLTWYLEGKFFHFPRYKRDAHLVIKKIRAGGSLLDVGCGSGERLAIFRECGFNGEGTEISLPLVTYVREKLGLNVHYGSLENLNLPMEKYDAVLLFSVFEHLSTPEETLRIVHTLLKPGGWVIMYIPVTDSLQYPWFRERWTHMEKNSGHFFIPSQAGVESILQRNGFRIREWQRCCLRATAGSFAISLLSKSSYREVWSENWQGLIWRICGIFFLLFPGMLFALFEHLYGTSPEMLCFAQKK